MSAASTWSNQVEKVFSLSASRSRPEISFQTPSAVSSIGFSTLAGHSLLDPKRRASIATPRPALNAPSEGFALVTNTPHLQVLRKCPTHLSTPVDLCLNGRRGNAPFGSGAPLDVHRPDTFLCGQATPRPSSILASRRPPAAFFFLRTSREAHLSAQRTSTEA